MTEINRVKFVARQAILNRDQDVFGYELLYRDSTNNFFPAHVSDDAATARLFFDSLLFYGSDKLVNNKKMFINLSTSSILSDLPKLIDPENVVLEIIERTEQLSDIEPLIDNLMQNRYIFALDDYDFDSKWDNLLQKVKYIKLEIEDDLSTTVNRVKSLKSKFPTKRIIVERIEDYKTFEIIKEAGADYFQGYYFTKPELLSFKNINPSQLTILSLLKLTLQKPFDFNLLINKVERDAGLVVRILRLSNLRCKSSSKKISSISQAIIFLGEDTIKRFITVIALGDLGESKPSELLRIGLVRAKFIERLLQHTQSKLIDMGYLLGLISIFTALTDVALPVIIKEFSLDSEIQDALENKTGKLGDYFTLCMNIENSNFKTIEESQKLFNLTEAKIMQCYVEALAYADESLDCL